MAHSTAIQTTQPQLRSLNPLKWLMKIDRNFREVHQLIATEDHHLKDMGITRAEANAAFYTKYSENRWHARMR